MLLDLGNLRSQCVGIGRIACKDFHGHGAAVFAGEQAEDDLFLALFLVPGVAILGQLEGFAFNVGGGYIRERALLEVLASEALFDGAFALQQSIHGLVEVVLVNVFETEFGTERMASGIRVQGGTSGEFAFGIKDTGSDKGDGEAWLFGVFGCDDAMELQVTEAAEYGGDVSMGDTFGEAEGVLEGVLWVIDGDAPAQEDADVVDDIIGEFGDIGEGGFDDFAAIAFALADEVGGAGTAVGDGGDVHGYLIRKMI